MQAGPFLGERGGDLWARMGMFGYAGHSGLLWGSTMVEHLYPSPLSPEPPGASWPISPLPSLVGLTHAVGAGQAAARLE